MDRSGELILACRGCGAAVAHGGRRRRVGGDFSLTQNVAPLRGALNHQTRKDQRVGEEGGAGGLRGAAGAGGTGVWVFWRVAAHR